MLCLCCNVGSFDQSVMCPTKPGEVDFSDKKTLSVVWNSSQTPENVSCYCSPCWCHRKVTLIGSVSGIAVLVVDLINVLFVFIDLFVIIRASIVVN